MKTIQQFAAKLNREAAEGLAKTARAMPADRTTWKPLDAGRSALDQVQECAGFGFMGAQILRERAVPSFDPVKMEQFQRQTDTMEKAVAALEQGQAQFATAVEAFPTEHLEDTLTLPFGEGGMTMTYAEFIMVMYWNNVYHIGQINYIQTLYGDTEMH